MYVTDDRAARQSGAVLLVARLRPQRVQIQRRDAHVQMTIDDRPLGARPIAIDLDPVVVRVREVQRLADPMVRGALHGGVRLHEPPHRAREIGARRDKDRKMIEAGGAGHARRGCVLREDQEIGSTGAEPGRPIARAVNDETEMRFVEANRTPQIRNRQMDRADRCARIDHGPRLQPTVISAPRFGPASPPAGARRARFPLPPDRCGISRSPCRRTPHARGAPGRRGRGRMSSGTSSG